MLRRVLVAVAAAGLVPSVALATTATVYKSPACGCCAEYVEYLEQNGYTVRVEHPPSMPAIKDRHGVMSKLASCHTMRIDGYTFEGHIPLDAVERVLEERPEISGISAPGMPTGVPGMGGEFRAPLQVFTLQGDVYATYFRMPE